MPRDEVLLLDMLNAARLIQEFVAGIDRETFDRDIMRQDAILRRITIIGEATRRLADAFKNEHPDVPWAKIAGMRNRLIHEYAEVDLDLVWDVIQNDIPALIEWIEPLIPPDPDRL